MVRSCHTIVNGFAPTGSTSAIGAQLGATAQLYRALGGGWMKPDVAAAPAGKLPSNPLGAR